MKKITLSKKKKPTITFSKKTPKAYPRKPNKYA